ncbi:MAG TPA: heme-binding protein, partial [Acidimicrobiia bacterium]|nr:heme-binding protein [Acidimicrobiia bacterium]
MSRPPRVPGLSLDDADRLVRATLEAGADHGFPPLAAVVVDLTGEPIALRRSDGAKPMASRIALAKARSALISLGPSGALDGMPPGIIAAMQAAYGGDFVPRAGGVPVVGDGVLLGAAGASGATS